VHVSPLVLVHFVRDLQPFRIQNCTVQRALCLFSFLLLVEASVGKALMSFSVLVKDHFYLFWLEPIPHKEVEELRVKNSFFNIPDEERR
jgi:hypothetical protein